ncbi:MAG: Flp pilus assembly complex ATPase component TadA [Lachnospiraceae bacterium]|nr:Flp pilus assembly complex ATPase component TadA [Lachnospiraceae bacterium]
MAGFRTRIRLGDVLIQKGIITEEQLTQALDEQKKVGGLLGETMVNMGMVSEDKLIDVLCEQLGIEYLDLRKVDDIPGDIVSLIPEDLIRKYTIMPIKMSLVQMNTLVVAMADPMNIYAIDDISIVTGLQIEPVLSTTSQIKAKTDSIFGQQQAQDIAEAYKKEQEAYFDSGKKKEDTEDESRKEDVENSPIVLLVKGVIEQAVRQRASDIHIEAFEHNVRVRYRVDGSLREIVQYDKALFNAIIARIKILSGMDISEKRKPQDGRITQVVDRKEYDIRVSCLPTVFGEKVVMRIASKEGFNKNKLDLGLRPEDLVLFDNILKNPNGIILVTGPTGSGKSTTLYTALSELNTEDVNIITVEDPVEANIDGINQVHVNVKANLTFASALRSILRQDPDIIMIGEIRDGETAGIAVKASITGHLVVSTLHTNSTAATIGRLVDMGVEPYLLGDSLVGIIAQRLVRRLCPDCKKPVLATEDDKRKMGMLSEGDMTIYEPGGCPACDNSGYRGRIGIYEIMTITSNIKRLIARSATAEEIKAAAEAEGMSSLRHSAAKYVKEGITSIAEMMKATYSADEE